MKNINWKDKLSSRKFWAGAVGFITPILVAFAVPDITVEQITAIITAVGALCVYMLSEASIDKASINSDANVEKTVEDILSVDDSK